MSTNFEWLMQDKERTRNAISDSLCKTQGFKCMRDKTCTQCHIEWLDAEHVEPATQEKIDADARKYYEDYWSCTAFCSLCPAVIDGKKPHERYNTMGSCTTAQCLDSLRRQRELDARLMGGKS